MKRHRTLIVLILVAAAVLWLLSALGQTIRQAITLDTDQIVFTDSYNLSSTIAEPLVVIADRVALDGDSHVQGDTALIGRSQVQMNGHIQGDFTGMSANLAIGGSARVSGDAALVATDVILSGRIEGNFNAVADRLTIEPGALVTGEVVACVREVIGGNNLRAGQLRRCSEGEHLSTYGPARTLFGAPMNLSSPLTGDGLMSSALFSLALTGIGALAVSALPGSFSRIVEAVRGAPRRLAGLGCLTLLLALLLALLLGWITLALLLGDWLLRRLTRSALPPLIAVIAGSAALFVIWHLLALIPFGALAGLIVMLILGVAGLGAALATRLGTRSLRQSYFVQG